MLTIQAPLPLRRKEKKKQWKEFFLFFRFFTVKKEILTLSFFRNISINKIFKTDKSKKENEEYNPYSICQNILGRLTVAQQKEKELKNQMIPLPDSVVKTLEKQHEQSPQEQFKDQLMNSLFQVLQ